MTDTTTIILRAGGKCEIKMDWLANMYAQFEKLALKVDGHLKSKKKSPTKPTGVAIGKKYHIIWRLFYFLEDDSEELESFPQPSIRCEIEIVMCKDGEYHRATLRNEVMGFGRGPTACARDKQGQFDLTFNHDEICAEIVPQLIKLVMELETA